MVSPIILKLSISIQVKSPLLNLAAITWHVGISDIQLRSILSEDLLI